MADSEANSRLEQVDLSRISLEDLRTLKNSAVRDALLEMIRNPQGLLASGHQNHGSHGNHSTDAASFLNKEIVQGVINPAIEKKG
jgi:hypothetical protein